MTEIRVTPSINKPSGIFDLLVVCLGYETRAAYIAERYATTSTSRLAIAFHVGWPHAGLLQAQLDFIRDRLNLPGIGAVTQDEVIGECSRSLFHLQNGQIFSFFLDAGLDGGVYLLFEIVLLHAVVGALSLIVGR